MIKVLKRAIADFHQAPPPAVKLRRLHVPLDLPKIATVIGPRRAGKTYYLYQLMARLEASGVPRQRMVYLNFEDERLSFDGGYDVIFDAYRELYQDENIRDVFFFFDEVQDLPDWEKFVRRTFDSVSPHLFLTGSNSKLLSREIATALRGRSLAFELLPLSFQEFLQFSGINPGSSSSADKARVRSALDEYSLWGGFPEILGLSSQFKTQTLQEYFNVMLYRDLAERHGFKDVAVLRHLVKRLAASFTKEFSVNKLYNEFKSRGFSVGKDTLYEMADAVFAIYMAASVERYDPSIIRTSMGNKKIYLYDNGFATALRYANAEDRGKRLENMVFLHLRRMECQIHFARNGWECDFVVHTANGRVCLIQVTERLDVDNAARELKGLACGLVAFPGADAFMIAQSFDSGVSIPANIRLITLQEWLLADDIP